jgi:hypothetical protein
MTIEVKYILGNVSNSTYSSSFLNSIFGNIIYTAIILSIVLLVIICFIYPCKQDTPISNIFKLLFYIFISITFVLYLHSGIINYKYEKKLENTNVKNIIGGITNPSVAFSGDRIEIKPKLGSNSLLNNSNSNNNSNIADNNSNSNNNSNIEDNNSNIEDNLTSSEFIINNQGNKEDNIGGNIDSMTVDDMLREMNI